MLAAVFSFLVMAAGWYYLWYSRAADGLAGLEQAQLNRRRVRLRRAGGAAMLLLGAFLYAGMRAVDPQESETAFVAVWGVVVALLATMVVLALADLRLTWKIRRGPNSRDSL